MKIKKRFHNDLQQIEAYSQRFSFFCSLSWKPTHNTPLGVEPLTSDTKHKCSITFLSSRVLKRTFVTQLGVHFMPFQIG